MQDYVSEQYVNKDIGLELVSNPISIQKRKAMKSRQNYSSPRMTVLSSKLRATILAGSGIGGKNTGEDFPFGSRERQSDVQTTNID